MSCVAMKLMDEKEAKKILDFLVKKSGGKEVELTRFKNVVVRSALSFFYVDNVFDVQKKLSKKYESYSGFLEDIFAFSRDGHRILWTSVSVEDVDGIAFCVNVLLEKGVSLEEVLVEMDFGG